MIKSFKAKDLLTVPNLLSYLRLALIAPFVSSFLDEKYIQSAVLLGISGLSDALDGFVARRFNQVTSIGKILDPIADKLTLIAIMICITVLSPIVMPVMIILIIKDFLMLLGGVHLLKNHLTPPAAKWYGKVGTLMFYISVCVIVFLKAAFDYENGILSVVLLSATAAMMIFSLIKYFILYLSLVKGKGDNKIIDKKETR